jgi:hypothetical protein
LHRIADIGDDGLDLARQARRIAFDVVGDMHGRRHVRACARKRQNHGASEAASTAGDNAGRAGKIGCRHIDMSLI